MALDGSSSLILIYERFYLATFFSFVAAFYTFRIVRMQAALKQKVVFPGTPYCSSWWNHLAFRLFRIAIWLVCLVRAFWPEFDGYLGTFPGLYSPAISLAGLTLLTVGFVLTIAIHFKMGNTWRSGIDNQAPTKLFTTGYYAYSRNPMYVFVAMAQLGFFLAVPSVFTLVCLVVGVTSLYRQTIQEELHLGAKFPELYPSYCASVRRWV